MEDVTGGRRELRKARTRAEIRAAAHRLFAERGFEAVTTADIAAAADVAVQTVFNHFESKEALFHDGRIPDISGPAAAVAGRPPGTGPLTALRRQVERDISALVADAGRPERSSYVEAMVHSPDLQTRSRMLVAEAVELTVDALATALAGPARPAPAPVELLARLAAELFFNAGAVLVAEHRRTGLAEGWTPAGQAAALAAVTATFGVLEDAVRELAGQLGLSVD
ncbi:TetR family transcriptional regulator [Modestobacter sp. VKM Ac-2986]|uniref:TetR family transcriptional regulator n=1 Tax=Modestobacter sp. VKM Ac-2986 TaxID=3004140 RepID=UPI0022AB8F33|nr:TetR family transcriptional regulator [Modestobacter sp. VKM Ac-2986]MCZ2830897.1 TetR family transcriptional regulator [Modestobacter sp. VKM Ac-2986]